MAFRIHPSNFCLSLMAVAILLAVAHLSAMISRYILGDDFVFGLVDTFDLNLENNIPTVFSTFILMASAVLLAVIARHAATIKHNARYWKWLAVIFMFLAVDENASLHELFIDPIQEMLPSDGIMYVGWIIPYTLAALVIGLLYLKFVWSLPTRTRNLTILSGSIYLSGAIGFELLGGWYLLPRNEIEDFPYSMLVLAEEFLEMAGIILFIYTLLDYLKGQLGGKPLQITLSESK
jgi:hypothetical protein